MGDSGAELTCIPWRRCKSDPVDSFDWLRSDCCSSQDQEDEKSKPGSSRLKKHERSLSDCHADLTTYYRIDSKLTEKDVEQLPQQPLQGPLQHGQQQLQQLRRL